MIDKKKILFILCISITFFLFTNSSLFAAGKNRVVLIDPAHGGKDKGVKLNSDVTEKDITLAVAQSIKKELAGEKNLEVILTRDADQAIDLEERTKNIEKIKPDFFISLHVNGGFGKHASGFEIYYPAFGDDIVQDKKAAKDSTLAMKNKCRNESLAMAKIVQDNLNTLFPRKGRGMRKAELPVVEGVLVPALAVEMSFATNAEDKKKLLDSDTKAGIAKAIAKSIKRYFR